VSYDYVLYFSATLTLKPSVHRNVYLKKTPDTTRDIFTSSNKY